MPVGSRGPRAYQGDEGTTPENSRRRTTFTEERAGRRSAPALRRLTGEGKRRYLVVVAGKRAISTPFPSAYAVAKKLGVRKGRATHLIRLMDSIHTTDAVAIVGGNGGRHKAPKKAKAARRSARTRFRRG